MNWLKKIKISMRDKYIDEIYESLEKSPTELGLNNIFGDKLRITVPFENEVLNDIVEKLYQKGYYSHLSQNTAAKEIQTINGKKLRTYNLLKLIKDELGEEYLKEFIDNGGNSTIVLSRSPIDVLRMSDFKGIESCHSQGGSYFSCAIIEAKKGGAIAYVVNKNDINKVDLNAKEIFKDSDRNIGGINPSARLRIRRFVDKKDESEDIGLPELRIYGNKVSGLYEYIKKFLKEKQGLDKKRPRMSDYYLYGGSYQDTQADEMFNSFFDDDEDYGNVSLQDNNEDLKSLWENEINDIEARYHGWLKIFNVYQDLLEQENHLDLMCNFEIILKIYDDLHAEHNFDIKYNTEIYEEIKNFLKNIGLRNLEDITVFKDGDLQIRFTPDNVNNPDDLRELYQDLIEIEGRNGNIIVTFLYNIFHNQYKPIEKVNQYQKLTYDIENNDSFQQDIDEDRGETTVHFKLDINVGKIAQYLNLIRQYCLPDIKKIILDKINYVEDTLFGNAESFYNLKQFKTEDLDDLSISLFEHGDIIELAIAMNISLVKGNLELYKRIINIINNNPESIRKDIYKIVTKCLQEHNIEFE